MQQGVWPLPFWKHHIDSASNYQNFLWWAGHYGSDEALASVSHLNSVSHRHQGTSSGFARPLRTSFPNGQKHLPWKQCKHTICRRCESEQGGWDWKWVGPWTAVACHVDDKPSQEELHKRLSCPWPQGLWKASDYESVDVRVSCDDIQPHPFGEAAILQTMLRALQKIGSVEHWTSMYGQMFEHCSHLTMKIVMLINMGVAAWTFTPSWDVVSLLYPTATRGTWWILLQTEHDNGDKRLYLKLVEAAKTVSWINNPANAGKWLQQISGEMALQDVVRLGKKLKAHDVCCGAVYS